MIILNKIKINNKITKYQNQFVKDGRFFLL